MKYTICTVVNDNYLGFLHYFTKSALEKCTNLDKLIILYTGYAFPDDALYQDSRVKIVKYHQPIETQKIWDGGWEKNVNLKSQFLRDLAVDSDQPIFLIDVDCYFLREFIDVIDPTKDIAVTKRDNIPPYIASFVGLIKPKSCLEFIDTWRTQMASITTMPKETRALCQTVAIMGKKLKIQEIPDTTISCLKIIPMAPDARILHFKGKAAGDAAHLLKKRLESLESIL